MAAPMKVVMLTYSPKNTYPKLALQIIFTKSNGSTIEVSAYANAFASSNCPSVPVHAAKNNHPHCKPCGHFQKKIAGIRDRVNLTRYHGVFAPNSHWRDQVTPGNKGNGPEIQTEDEEEEGKEKRRGMSWVQRLKRVFGIDVEVCPHCGGGVRIIACIEDPVVIRQILSHVEAKQTCNRQQAGELPLSRAPPQFGLFG